MEICLKKQCQKRKLLYRTCVWFWTLLVSWLYGVTLLHSRSCFRGSFYSCFLMWMCVSYSPMHKFWMPLRIRSHCPLKPDLPALVKNTALLQTAQLWSWQSFQPSVLLFLLFFSSSFSAFFFFLFAIQLIISGSRAWHEGLYPTAEVVCCEGHCDILLERKDLWYHQRIFTKQHHKDLCCLYCYWQEYLEQRSIWAQISFRSERGAANLNVESRVRQQAWSDSQKE